MKRDLQPKLIAIVGGSGAGKTWLAEWLEREFAPDAARLALDDFYRDFSHVSPAQRPRINFDDPTAIDWLLVESALRETRLSRLVWVPNYDFATHTRLRNKKAWSPKPFVFVDGLWLLWRPSVRSLFDLRIFIEAPEELRWRRRLARDVTERGRTPDSVREQFHHTVAPMHERFVEPQARWADIVLRQPLHEDELNQLPFKIREHLGSESISPSPLKTERGGVRGDHLPTKKSKAISHNTPRSQTISAATREESALTDALHTR